MTPDSMANGVEEQKLLLKQYLGQYYYAKMKKKQLEARLRTFRENMLGTKGMQYSPVPRVVRQIRCTSSMQIRCT